MRAATLVFIGRSSMYLVRGSLEDTTRIKVKPCPQPTKKRFVFINRDGAEYRIDVRPVPGGFRAEIIMSGGENGKKIAQARSVDLTIQALRGLNPGCTTRRVDKRGVSAAA